MSRRRNPVAKYSRINRATVHTDRKREMKKHGHRIELDDDDIICPMCYAPQTEHDSLLGILGTLAHYRCRYCGADFTRENDNASDS